MVPTPEPNVADLLARLDAQDKKIAQLTASKTAPIEDKGYVRVSQWRVIMNESGNLEKHDEQEQIYDADVFDKMMHETDGKTAFGHLGYAAPVILEDTRKAEK